jgi:hypothetical protein
MYVWVHGKPDIVSDNALSPNTENFEWSLTALELKMKRNIARSHPDARYTPGRTPSTLSIP